MKKHPFLAAAGALLLACGGNEAEQAQEQAQAAAEQPQAAEANMQAQQAAQAGQNAQAAQGGASNFGTVTLSTGFMPDPHKAEGTSGGARDASGLGAGCVGYISETPDHLFVASDSFTNLRIMAHSSGDVTLVVQKPDGSYLCNDDFEGTDPLVEGSFPPGTYKIWIGSYEQGTNSPYKLGFSELSSVTPATLNQ